MDVEIKDTIEIQQLKYAKVSKERESDSGSHKDSSGREAQ